MRISDWSSDVCSSDLTRARTEERRDSEAVLERQSAECVDPRRIDHRHAHAVHGGLQQSGDVRPGGEAAEHGVDRSGSGEELVLERGQQDAELQAAYRRHLARRQALLGRSEEHTSELQSLMRISYAVFCLKKKKP